MNSPTNHPDLLIELRSFVDRADPAVQVADWAEVSQPKWAPHLKSLCDLTVDADGRITRAQLRQLAAVDRDERSAESVTSLFWHIMAWGISGDWRRVERIRDQFLQDGKQITTVLRLAQDRSYEGDVIGAYQAIRGRIKFFGRAFFTKFLHFTADLDSVAKTHALILDSRVLVAWRVFADEWLDETSGSYVRYCETANAAARDLGISPERLEGHLFEFGQQVGTYERWLIRNLDLCRKRLPDGAPTLPEVWATF